LAAIFAEGTTVLANPTSHLHKNTSKSAIVYPKQAIAPPKMQPKYSQHTTNRSVVVSKSKNNIYIEQQASPKISPKIQTTNSNFIDKNKIHLSSTSPPLPPSTNHTEPIDLEEITEKVLRKLKRDMAIERERRGQFS
jgi:hypothetical protein